MKSSPTDFLIAWVFVFLSIGYCWDQIDKLTAVQELQRRGYSIITPVDRIRFAAGFRTNCSFYEYGRMTFYAENKNKEYDFVSVCVGLISNPTIYPGK